MIHRTPFHLVEYSPWPIIASTVMLSMPLGFISYTRFNSLNLLIMAMVAMTFISGMWWRDIIRESTYQGHHTSYVVSGLKMGVALFILSEVCFFFAFFWAYFHSSLAPAIEVGSVWPPVGVTTLSTFSVPLLNTSLLLLSGVSITWSHHALESGHMKSSMFGLLITCLLGVYFTYLQYSEYSEASFAISDGIYGSVFYVATGFHGLHVIIGVTFLLVNLVRMYKYHFSRNHHVGFLAAAWYWHFVDVVWLFLYVSIYWWGS
uniref:Cytochrome c oxidase subunit 3 n=1 Tax=Arion ater ater TaxID=2751868 RepID=A0A8F3AER2_9EUPU|nr:cytochrome c oxidase subunit 3 [Arion ater ater]